ncbi:hypothetical protein FKP32DRAFT_1595894 [Trametes sanguinea]|nr:hypothetical protein FKP32DRAFT_1595894 [Trametes sanguinea]
MLSKSPRRGDVHHGWSDQPEDRFYEVVYTCTLSSVSPFRVLMAVCWVGCSRYHARVLLASLKPFTPPPHCKARLPPRSTGTRNQLDGIMHTYGTLRLSTVEAEWSTSESCFAKGIDDHDSRRSPVALRGWMQSLFPAELSCILYCFECDAMTE